MDLVAKCNALTQQGLYPSAALLASIVEREHAGRSPLIRHAALVALGDALAGSQQHLRAVAAYRRAASEGTGDSPELRIRIARSLVASEQESEAICELEKGERNAAGSILLVQLRRRLKSTKGLVQELENALKKEPMALEAAQLLIELEADVPRVEQLAVVGDVITGSNGKDAPPTWMVPWMRAHAAIAAFDLTSAQTQFRELLTLPSFRNHPHVFNALARIEVGLGNREGAMAAFNRSRALEPLDCESADLHASLLRFNADTQALTALCHNIFPLRKTRPEPWVALALLQEAKGQMATALSFVHRALEIDPLHLPAIHYLGALHLTMGKPAKSLEVYTRAYAVRRDFTSFKGIVFALLNHAPPKVDDALVVAKEALETMPLDARTCIVVGRVFSANVDTEDKALRAFARAMRLDPLGHEAPCCLADVCLAQHERGSFSATATAQAIAALKALVDRPAPKDFVLFKLGKLHAIAGDVAGALSAFHHVLSVNPSMTEARDAIEQLE